MKFTNLKRSEKFSVNQDLVFNIWSEREELNASLDEAGPEKIESVDTNLTSVLTDDDVHFGQGVFHEES